MATDDVPKPGLYISPPLAGRETFEVCGRHFAKYGDEAGDLAGIAKRVPHSRTSLIEYSEAMDAAEEDAQARNAPSAAPGPGDFIALGIPERGATWPLVEACVRHALGRRNLGDPEAPSYRAPAEALRVAEALCAAVSRAKTEGTERALLDALSEFVGAAGGEPADFYATGAPLAAVAAALHAQLRGEAGRDAYRAIVREGDRDAAR